MLAADHQTDSRASVPDSEILLIAIAAAQYFHNHHERAVCVLSQTNDLSGKISVSRFNRRIHQLAAWLPSILQALSLLADIDGVVIIDSMPVPVCKRVRARRCKKVQGRLYCGFCPAGYPMGQGEVFWLALASGLYTSRRSDRVPDCSCKRA